MTDKTDATDYASKGHKVPENPKARKKSVTAVYDKIEKLKVAYETIKLGYLEQEKIIAKAKADQEVYKAQIDKFKKRKAELEEQIKELQEIQYNYDELAELKEVKSSLEKEIASLKTAKTELEKTAALLEDIELDEEDI